MPNFRSEAVQAGVAADWSAENPVLQPFCMGMESDTGRYKIGDGVTRWSALPYSSGDGGGSVDPAAAETITGEWAFADTAAPVAATLHAPGVDSSTGEHDPNGDVVFTATTPGSAGNLLMVAVGPSLADPLVVAAPPSSPAKAFVLADYPSTLTTVFIRQATDADGTAIIPTGNDFVTAVNSEPTVTALLTAANGAGSNGTGFGPPVNGVALNGGADTRQLRVTAGRVSSAVEIRPKELSQTPLTLVLQPGSAMGTALLNIMAYDGTPLNGGGYGITHLDGDGGGGLAGERIIWSPQGAMAINTDGDTAAPPLTLTKGGATELSFMNNYGALVIGQGSADRRMLVLQPYSIASTADAIKVENADDGSAVFRVRPDGAAITKAAEPADDELLPGEVAWWYDPTEGAPRIRFKGKDTAGTVFDLSP